MSTPLDSFVPEVLAYARNCPDMTITSHVRSAIIELCEQAEVYQLLLDEFGTVAGQYEYDIDAPSGTVLHRMISVLYKGYQLEPINQELADQRFPDWRSDTGTPQAFVKQSNSLMWIFPVPGTAEVSALRVRAILKPSRTTTSMDTEVANNYWDTIVSGTLARVLRMPSRDWTDLKTASIYYAMFQEQVNAAKIRARQADNPIVPIVSYGGIGSSIKVSTSGKYVTRRR